MDSGSQSIEVAAGNIIAICVDNVSTWILLDYCKTIKNGRWILLLINVDWNLFETSVELKVHQHKPRNDYRTFSKFHSPDTTVSTIFLLKQPPTSIRMHGAEYYEWRVCSSAFSQKDWAYCESPMVVHFSLHKALTFYCILRSLSGLALPTHYPTFTNLSKQ